MLSALRAIGTEKDYYWSNTVALIKGDGINGSTTITDSSPLAGNWTAGGAVAVSTSQSKFGSASLSFSGALGNYITPSAAGSNFTFGTGDFTIEAWVYATAFTGATRIIFDFRPNATEGAYPVLYCTNTGGLFYFANNSNRITGATLSTANWYHLAVSRSGTSTKLFVDGTQSGSTYTDSTNYLVGTTRPRIGGNANGNDTNNWNGYLDDIRITKGVARYTANFTAPTSAHFSRG